jgi:hypothetical protein
MLHGLGGECQSGCAAAGRGLTHGQLHPGHARPFAAHASLPPRQRTGRHAFPALLTTAAATCRRTPNSDASASASALAELASACSTASMSSRFGTAKSRRVRPTAPGIVPASLPQRTPRPPGRRVMHCVHTRRCRHEF